MANSNGKASATNNTFSRETSVRVDIQSDLKTIWGLLTNAENYPKWNSTVIFIYGKIALDEKYNLNHTLTQKEF